MTKSARKFAVCISNEGCDDLTLHKLYRIVRDTKAARSGFLRIIDDSLEDYLYPEKMFVVVAVPVATSRKLTVATGR